MFEPAALRAEDTLLLAHLIQDGELPLFVPDAVVEHAIPLSLMQCVREGYSVRFSGGRAYGIIASKGVRIRISTSGTSEIAAVHVESRQPGFHRAIRLVCARGEAVPAAR